jgi:hypothetical protein
MNALGYFLASLSLLTLLFALFTMLSEYFRNKRMASNPLPQLPQLNQNPVLPYISQHNPATLIDSKAKGYAFEKYIATKFDRTRFTCLDWRGDKHHEGIFPVANSYPDLVFQYHDHIKKVAFAIECKWRACFQDNAIRWTYSKQMDGYFAFQKEKRLPVIVVIGIGGSPDSPQELYAVPLKKIQKHQLYLTTAFLGPYRKRNSDSNFFFDTDALTLL